MPEQITYDHQDLQDAVSNLKQRNNDIHQAVEDMRNDARKLVETWNGTGSESYDTKNGEINKEFGDMTQALNQLSAAVGSSQEDMDQSDRKIGQSFSK